MRDDFFDSGPLVPAFSWEGMAKGTTVTGILAKPYETTQQTTIEGKPKTWDDGRPMMQAVLTLQTDFRDHEHISEQALAKLQADGIPDDGLRKLYVRGSLKQPSLNKGLRDALRKAGATKPEVGGTVAVTFVKKTPIPGSQYKQNDFAVTYTPPTPATLAKVEQHQPVGATVGGGAGFDSGSHDEDPPF